jgi:hypothetical protein
MVALLVLSAVTIYFFVFRFGRAGLYLDDAKVVVLSPWARARIFCWRDVARFESSDLGPLRLGAVVLKSGKRARVWGLQAGTALTAFDRDDLESVVCDLNALVASTRT